MTLQHPSWSGLISLNLAMGIAVTQVSLFAADSKPSAPDFNRDIRPILSDNCFVCHGPDDKERQAGLRLDQRGSATKAAESGAVAIVPGQVEASELIKRVTSTDEATRMPPLKGKHKPLTASQIDLLKRWVASGAECYGGDGRMTGGTDTKPSRGPQPTRASGRTRQGPTECRRTTQTAGDLRA